ncbi:MAG: PP2C family protein-serine/threonine phosphatase [Terriglobia bacterium]
MFYTLRHEYRSHRWARFTFWLIVSGAILWILKAAAGWSSGLLWVLFAAGVIAAGAYYVVRLAGFARRRLLWRLTRRLVVTYVFIAFVPIILILLLVGLGAFILNGQFAAYLVNSRLRNHFDELKQINRVVAHEAAHIQARDPQELFDALENFYVGDLQKYASSYPGLEITLREGGAVRAFHLSGEPMQQPISEPRWLTQEEWSGFVMNRGELSLTAVNWEPAEAGRLMLILSMPVTPQLLSMVGDGIGPVAVIPLNTYRADGGRDRNTKSSEWKISKGGRFGITANRVTAPPKPDAASVPARWSVQSGNVPLPTPRSWVDFVVHGASAINPVLWHAPKYTEASAPILVIVRSRIFPLNDQLLRILGRYSGFWPVAFIVVGIIFLVIEIAALVIGVLLTRSITSTVNRLQVATERVKRGDFSHRIGLPAHDQVSALGTAFDTMTASVERLMAESREKLRLESELNIAREVQQQLFPQNAPEVDGACMFGECRPARGVSGDYYDFLKFGHAQVGLVLGDVSGKGIYAALLMAGIQSAVRAQLYDGNFPAADQRGHNGHSFSTAVALDRLNRQVYENTPDAKYATFFYALFDAGKRTLLYTNAGHPPPFLFRRNTLSRLDAGGTVLGIFPGSRYQQELVHLEPGDVVVAYTDGLVEPENSYGEEFGEARLAKIIREAIDAPPEIVAEGIYRGIFDWTGSTEPQDDMTMLYLKTTG